jgi:hypothetical protein
MRATSISVSVRYSKPMLDGSYKTVELTCEASLNNSEETWQEAQTTLYKQLGEQMRYVFNGNSSGKPAIQEQSQTEVPAPPQEHWCSEHNQGFKRYEKDRAVWYSHRQGSSWHNEGGSR